MNFYSSYVTNASDVSYMSFCLSMDTIKVSNNIIYKLLAYLSCAVNIVTTPVAAIGNALVLAAIWRNTSLRTPSYLLLGVIALTDFGTAIMSQPLYAIYRLAELYGNTRLFCFGSLISTILPAYLTSIVMQVIPLMAIERWLHISRRSFLTVRRVYIILSACFVVPMPFFAERIWSLLVKPLTVADAVMASVFGVICFVSTAVAYFKVFQIIRRHQMEVHAHQTTQNVYGQPAINVAKYKRSVLTIFYILALFLICYSPHLFGVAVLFTINDFSTVSITFIYLSVTLLFMSSTLSPLLYCWRIKEIRDEVRQIVKTVLWKN